MGARPRHDGYGRLCGAELIPLEDLGRPRIDVVMTLSGIFRDLLPLQTRMLAEAAWLAATAEEPEDQNYIRAHALAYAAEHDCDLETASLRVFSNAEGAYGSNVNHLIDSGAWGGEDELADAFEKRKCFAYGARRQTGAAARPSAVDAAGCGAGLSEPRIGGGRGHHDRPLLRHARRHRPRRDPRPRQRGRPSTSAIRPAARATVRTLNEQVALETRTRALNPKWYEGMLRHGHTRACARSRRM